MKFFFNQLNIEKQLIISNEIIKIFKESPLFLPKTPRFNRPFKILITNAGKWGWKSDINGYGYVTKHPITKKKWPVIPKFFLEIWKCYCRDYSLPNSCLINLYKYPSSSLGLHQDKDENNFNNPVLSISLGSIGVFKYGKDKNNLRKVYLESGSIVVMDGDSRLDYHGIEKIIKIKKNILNEMKEKFPLDCRINITLRIYEPRID